MVRPAGTRVRSAPGSGPTEETAQETGDSGFLAVLKALEAAIKNAPLGTPDRTIVMTALRSVPPEMVREALLKADARHHSLFFSLIPADQVGPVINDILIGPTEQPEGVTPSPTNGPPAYILTTN